MATLEFNECGLRVLGKLATKVTNQNKKLGNDADARKILGGSHTTYDIHTCEVVGAVALRIALLYSS